MEIKAYQIADSIDLKRFKSDYNFKPHSYSSSYLFYTTDTNRYLYISTYGVVVFGDFNEAKISETIKLILNFSFNPLSEKLSEDFVIYQTDGPDRFNHNEAYLSDLSEEVIKIVMLNIGQSVALDYYQMQGSQMLDETNRHTKMLEDKGRLLMTNQTLLKFIGRTLNVKNNIFDHLYIFDQPESTWNDPYLHKVDMGIRNLFDIKSRFNNIDYNLKIVNDNLELFKDLLQHRRSTLLEIIIIALILVEVISLFIEKLFY